jgi:hypothetical protein
MGMQRVGGGEGGVVVQLSIVVVEEGGWGERETIAGSCTWGLWMMDAPLRDCVPGEELLRDIVRTKYGVTRTDAAAEP